MAEAQHFDGGVDLAALRDALASPGMDTRQWVSFGTVDANGQSQDDQSVSFEPEFGPLVNVTLEPSSTSVRCRVAGHVAGNQEGEYYPFVAGDEVIVAIPEGDERAGCTIIGRLNNAIDAWPGGIAGQDATANNFGFKRIMAPYILEFANSYLMRSAGTGAFLSMTQDGQVTLSDANSAFLTFTPDFIGLQNGDGSLLFQMNASQQAIILQTAPPTIPTVPPTTGTTTLTLAQNSSLFSAGSMAFNTAGHYGLEHAASAEGVANMLYNVLVAMWTPLIPVLAAAVTGSPGSPLFAVPLTPFINPAAIVAAINAGLATAGTASIAPFAAAVAAALLAKVPGDTTGLVPSIGSPGILVG